MKTTLLIMAAGLGSRYGGMKQIDPVGPNGQVIVDYSLYDARRAGFETVIFVIKHEIEDAFKAAIGERVSKAMNVKYAFQQLDELPAGFAVPEGRVKPWGPCHAVLAAKNLIDGPFAVINADDYYGPEAFRVMYDYLSTHEDGSYYDYSGIIHEFGHFMVAKLCGVQVNEFSIGMGPKLCSFHRGKTEYRLSWLPFGGYVASVGEYSDEVEELGFTPEEAITSRPAPSPICCWHFCCTGAWPPRPAWLFLFPRLAPSFPAEPLRRRACSPATRFWPLTEPLWPNGIRFPKWSARRKVVPCISPSDAARKNFF